MQRAITIGLVLFFLGGCGSPPPKTTEPEAKGVSVPSERDVPMAQEEAPAPEEDNGVERNHPPEVLSVKLHPRLAYPGVKVRAEVEVRDEDGDPVLLEYRWMRNREVLPEVTGELDTKGFKKGDFITLVVVPFDGRERGKARKSLPLVLANRPPRIVSTPPAALIDGKYVYRLKVVDEDGDDLTFTLDEGPEGMTLDPERGMILWNRPRKGEFLVRVKVSDGDAIAFQEFTLSITK